MDKYKNLVKNLNLIPHKEGGLFAETHRDQNGFASHIYYILKKNEISKWHKLKKNEILNFYDGDPLVVYLYNSTNDKKVNNIDILAAFNKWGCEDYQISYNPIF